LTASAVSRGHRKQGATKVLNDFAQDPFSYLDEPGKKTIIAAHSALLRKFTGSAFDEPAEMRWQESRPTEARAASVIATQSELLSVP